MQQRDKAVPLSLQNMNVGAPRFELGVSWSQTKRDSRYATPRKTYFCML